MRISLPGNSTAAKADTQKSCIKEITGFLSIAVPEQIIVKAIQNASLEKGKAWEKKLVGPPKKADASFYRGGKSGQWSDYFTEKETDDFMTTSARAMALAGYI